MIAKEPGGKLKLNLKKSSKNQKRENEEQWENKDNNKTGGKKPQFSMVASNPTIPIITLNTNKLKLFT